MRTKNTANIKQRNVIKVANVSKSFTHAEHQELLVLDRINLQIAEGEFVALLGKSGSGKSTLLRIIAGLTHPTEGEVYYRNKLVRGPAKEISMVFQNFALMPWLTVLQNVELGLEAQGVGRTERRERALAAIDTIGLDGFESAYPRELSGGMRQRVGFARAIVVNPDVLLMDEPFSALDVLTAENLRGDLFDLWTAKKTQTHAILFVTHNIEEAALLADRIIILSSDPGCVRSELKVTMPHPRHHQDPAFRQLVDHIYTLMTTSAREGGVDVGKIFDYRTIGIGYRIPEAGTSELTGLLETITDPAYEDKTVDLPELADSLHLDIDDLFPLTEALEILHFADVSKGDIKPTELGKRFAAADILERKKMFAEEVLKHVPLVRYIRQILDERSNHRVSEERFISKLEDFLSEKEAEKVLKVVIDWGRYAELFAYDYNTGMLSLENPE